VQALYLLDQYEDRLPSCAQIGTAICRQTRAPRAELFDLGFIQTIAQGAPVYDDRIVAPGAGQRMGLSTQEGFWNEASRIRRCDDLSGLRGSISSVGRLVDV
jgi:hypothetical protein